MKITIREVDGRVTVLSSFPSVQFDARREGNKISYTTTSDADCSCYYLDGTWQAEPDGRRLIGSYEGSAGASGIWNLRRIE